MDVEWEEVQAAFLSTSTDREEYLDRESGEVVSISESDDEEGEEPADDAEDEGEIDDGEEDLRLEFENDPDRFVAITPVALTDRVEWMNGFILTLQEKDLVAQLTRAAAGNSPERDFDRILRRIPEERGRWLGHMETQVQEIIEGWIEENDIESDTAPPWRHRGPRKRPKKPSGPG